MSKKYWLVLIVFLASAVYIAGYGTARYVVKEEKIDRAGTQHVTAETVLVALRGQGFLITQTYLFNQSITIDHTSGSYLKDLFWNQIVTASANVKVSSGVDLSKLSTTDISSNANGLTVALPQPSRYSTEVIGTVGVKNKQGVLKRLVDNDDGYNQALATLKAEAEKTALSPEILAELQEQTKNEVERLILLLSPSTTVNILFK